MNLLMKQTTKDNKRNPQAPTSVLEDLDYTDDTVMLPSQYKDAQEKINKITTTV